MSTDQEFTVNGQCACEINWSTDPAGSPATGTGISFITQWSEAGLGYQLVAAFGAAVVVAVVDVVKIGRFFYNSGSNWVDVPPTLYVLKGDSIVFGVEASPRAKWPAGKPVWSDGVPDLGTIFWYFFPYLKYQKVTFDAVGDKVITVECGNTKSVTVKVAELVVRFDPGEARPGIGNGRKATVTAKAMRVAGGAAVTVNLAVDNARATVSPASFVLGAGETEKSQVVTITGVALSDANRDTTLTATAGGAVIGTMPITVVKPTKYTIVATAESGPWTLKPGSPTFVIWTSPNLITVLDQFDVALTKPFEGAHVQERVKNPGDPAYQPLVGLDLSLLPQNWSPLSAFGTVYDVLRAEIDFMNAALAAAVVDGTAPWPPAPAAQGPFLLKFFVDGEELEGVTTRMRTLHLSKETDTNVVN